MKKLFFFIATLTTVSTYAQLNQFGFNGGATIANYKSKTDGNDESGNSKAGFTLGVLVNFSVSKNFIIQPAINWVQKGTKDEQTVAGTTEKVSLTTNHIEVPVNFLYRNNGFFIGAGPSFSLGVSGKWKYSDGTNKADQKVNYGSSDNDDLKAFDLGINALTGYEFKSGVFITANYNLGLSNLAAGTSTTTTSTLKSSYAGIKLGYVLNSSRK